jgi:hypothetical protein
MSEAGAQAAVSRAQQQDWARLIATLTRRFGDLHLAEEGARRHSRLRSRAGRSVRPDLRGGPPGSSLCTLIDAPQPEQTESETLTAVEARRLLRVAANPHPDRIRKALRVFREDGSGPGNATRNATGPGG